MSLRPSCNYCQAKAGRSHSDITLADFWNVDKVLAGVDDDNGISLLLGNTDKGMALLQSVREIEYHKVDFPLAIQFNKAWGESYPMNPERDSSQVNYIPLHSLNEKGIKTSFEKTSEMRIAIITFFQSQDNYGQLLQCYALQQVLRQMGHKPYLIRYGFHEKYFHWIKKKNLFTKTGRQEAWHQFKKAICHRNVFSERGFDAFRKKYLVKTMRCYNTVAELRHHPPKADCYQVWAQLLSVDDNKSFFLDFGPQNTKRISYAPSFALEDYPSELKEKLAEQLRKFDAISVREQSGVRICKEMGYEASLVLDPTLLLMSEQYKDLMKQPPVSNYCFAYHVNVTSKEELYWDGFLDYNKS